MPSQIALRQRRRAMSQQRLAIIRNQTIARGSVNGKKNWCMLYRGNYFRGISGYAKSAGRAWAGFLVLILIDNAMVPTAVRLSGDKSHLRNKPGASWQQPRVHYFFRFSWGEMVKNRSKTNRPGRKIGQYLSRPAVSAL